MLITSFCLYVLLKLSKIFQFKDVPSANPVTFIEMRAWIDIMHITITIRVTYIDHNLVGWGIKNWQEKATCSCEYCAISSAFTTLFLPFSIPSFYIFIFN